METSPDAMNPATSSSSIVMRAVKDISFGSAAGMASKVIEHPFDLTKVRLQSQVLDATARFNGPIDCLRQTWAKEGIRGLYRGLPAPIVGAMLENASLFLTYGELQNAIRYFNAEPTAPLSLPQLALAAAGAGAFTSFLLTPVELVKCKMQVQMLVPSQQPNSNNKSPTKPPGPISVLISVIRTNGIRGLWLGQTGTFIRETGGTAAWFATKEYIASRLIARRSRLNPESITYSPSSPTKPQLLSWESALSGAIAGAAFNLALFPADTVKSAVQTEAELRPGSKTSFVRTAKEMWRRQGVKGLYAGCGVTVARAIPSSGAIFLIYDGLNRRFG